MHKFYDNYLNNREKQKYYLKLIKFVHIEQHQQQKKHC
jgi:hypothetical protein